MRQIMRSFAVLVLLTASRCASLAAEPLAPSIPQSGPVSLGDGDYRLVGDRTDHLSLIYTNKTGSRQWQIKPTPLELTTAEMPEGAKSKLFWPDNAAPHVVAQVAMVRRKSESLMAVVKTVSEKKGYFWIFKLANIVESEPDVKELSPRAVLLSVGRPAERILAFSGDIHPPAFTVVTGIISETNPGEIEVGSITFEWCGYEEFALTGEIKPSYPKKALE